MSVVESAPRVPDGSEPVRSKKRELARKSDQVGAWDPKTTCQIRV